MSDDEYRAAYTDIYISILIDDQPICFPETGYKAWLLSTVIDIVIAATLRAIENLVT